MNEFFHNNFEMSLLVKKEYYIPVPDFRKLIYTKKKCKYTKIEYFKTNITNLNLNDYMLSVYKYTITYF